MTVENIESVPIEQPVIEADVNVNDQGDLPEESTEGVETESESPSSPEITEETSIDDLPLPGDEKEEKNDLPKWAKKRIEKKERLIEQAAAEAASYKAEVERLRSAQMNAPITQTNNVPQRDDFENEADYIGAVVSHVNNRNLASLQAEKARRDHESEEKAFQSKWKAVEEAGLKKFDDFDEKYAVLNSRDMPANRMMAEAIIDSPHVTELMQFLGSYPDHAKKIALKSPTEAVKEIAKLELRFTQRQNTKVTKSPKILASVKSNKGAEAQVDPANLNPEEYRQWYEARKKARR